MADSDRNPVDARVLTLLQSDSHVMPKAQEASMSSLFARGLLAITTLALASTACMGDPEPTQVVGLTQTSAGVALVLPICSGDMLTRVSVQVKAAGSTIRAAGASGPTSRQDVVLTIPLGATAAGSGTALLSTAPFLGGAVPDEVYVQAVTEHALAEATLPVRRLREGTVTSYGPAVPVEQFRNHRCGLNG